MRRTAEPTPAPPAPRRPGAASVLSRAACASLLATALLAVPHTPAHARITRLQVLDERPFADGASFGDTGSYLRIKAIAYGELDPAAPANRGIALIDQAPRNSRGLVEYDTDVEIMRPADPARGNGVLLLDVPNRGNKYVPSWLNDAPESPAGMVNDPTTLADAGTGFLFRRGYTLVWAGWQPEAPAANHGMRIRIPTATAGGLPIVARIRSETLVGTRGPEGAYRFPLPYPAATMEQAQLSVRATEAEPRRPLPADAYRWVDRTTIQLMPFATPATPRHIYDFVYLAQAPTVNGIGFAAIRDTAAYLRTRTGTRHAIAFGVSLSGRFLRHFLDLGMNRDEDGARVFDGMLPHIGGAGKVFANHPFAQPGRTATQHEDRFFPEIWAPVTHRDMLRDPATAPKIIETNTSTEYWQKGASLVHTAPDGTDLELPANVRMMLIAGVQHGGHFGTPGTPGFCAAPRNPVSAGPALRAMLVALTDWVVQGTEPPASLVPRHADGSAIPAAAIRMPAIPGIAWAPRDNAIGRPVDWVDPPPAPVDPMPTTVAAVDADGNETAGLRMPHLAVPLGTATGVNVYRDMQGELCDRDGMFIPFARTRAEREQRGDPRPSLQERYTGRDDYIARLTAAADHLVASRLLLPEDRDRLLTAAQSAPGF